MQPTLTATLPSSATWSQAYAWPGNLSQDVQHRNSATGWSATAVWGLGDGVPSTAVWSVTAGCGTHVGPSTGGRLFDRPLLQWKRTISPSRATAWGHPLMSRVVLPDEKPSIFSV